MGRGGGGGLTPDLEVHILEGLARGDVENLEIEREVDALLLLDNVLADVLARDVYPPSANTSPQQQQPQIRTIRPLRHLRTQHARIIRCKQHIRRRRKRIILLGMMRRLEQLLQAPGYTTVSTTINHHHNHQTHP